MSSLYRAKAKARRSTAATGMAKTAARCLSVGFKFTVIFIGLWSKAAAALGGEPQAAWSDRPPPPLPPWAPGQELACFVGIISADYIPKVVLPLGESSSGGVTLYFLGTNIKEQCGTPMGASHGASYVWRTILLDLSVYHQRMPDVCYFRTFAVTGVLLRGLEDDNQLPVLRVLDLVVKAGMCSSRPPYVAPLEPLLPRDGEEVLQLSIVAAPVAVAMGTGEELQPSLTPQQVADAWLGPPEGLATFLEQCSRGRVALPEVWRQQQEMKDAVTANRGVVSSLSLEDVISGARSVALGMALGQPQAYGDAAQQHALCMYLVARNVMRARVSSEWQRHQLLVYPEGVLEMARARCPGAQAAAAAGSGSATQDENGATGLYAAYSDVYYCNGCRSTAFLAAPTAADGTPMPLDQVLRKAAIRVLGVQAGLRDAKTPDGGPDATSGLSGAPTCYNGPQGHVLGWLEVYMEEQLWLPDLGDWAEPREYELPALGSRVDCLMRINVTAGNSRSSEYKFWVVFRMSDPSLGLYSAPVGEHQVVVYHMDQEREGEFLGYEVPTVWGPATDGMTPLVASLHMLGDDGPQGFLCVRFDGGSVDMEHQTARVQLCAVATPDAPCCSVLAPENLLPSPPAASTPPLDEYPKTPPSTPSSPNTAPSPHTVPLHSPEDPPVPTPTASFPSYPPSYPPAYTPVPTYPPSYTSSLLPLSHEEVPPPGYGDAQQQDSKEPWRPRRLRLG